MRWNALVALLACVSLASLARASIYYVSPSGNNADPGTKAKPKRTIQAAVDACAVGDQIWIAQGTFYENVVIGKAITLDGGYDPTFAKRLPDGYPTVIDGSSAGPDVSVTALPNNRPVTVDGMTITHGLPGFSAFNASVVLNGNKILTNSQSNSADGGGVDVEGDGTKAINATLTGNSIGNNFGARFVGGADLDLAGGTGIFTSNTVFNNGAALYYGGVHLGRWHVHRLQKHDRGQLDRRRRRWSRCRFRHVHDR